MTIKESVEIANSLLHVAPLCGSRKWSGSALEHFSFTQEDLELVSVNTAKPGWD
jgi:hypothetical protein